MLCVSVVYHDKITEAFVQTLKRILSTGNPKTVFIAMEKRLKPRKPESFQIKTGSLWSFYVFMESDMHVNLRQERRQRGAERINKIFSLSHYTSHSLFSMFHVVIFTLELAKSEFFCNQCYGS